MRFMQARWSWWLSLLVIANAACLLLFRCFITLDGPVHVLHAAILGDAIGTPEYTAHGLQYDLSGIDIGLLDPVAIVLLKLLEPEKVEVALGVVVLLMFGSGVLVYVKAYAGEYRVLTLLALPLSFSVLLVLGLFPFVFSIGLCLWLVGHWIQLERMTRRALLVAFGALVVCFFVHRGALLLVGFFAGVHEALLFMDDRGKFNERWRVLPGKLAQWLLAAWGLSLVAGAVHFLFLRRVSETVVERTPLLDLLHLRPLLLLDRLAERPLVGAFAVLVLVALGMAIAHLRRQRTPLVHHAPLCLGALFLIASVCIRTEWADLHYFAERAQLLGLLMLVLWAAVIVGNGSLALVITGCAIAFHALRAVYIERRMAHYADERAAVVMAAQHLKPGTLVATVHCSDDWLLLHQFAHLATRHKGIVLTKRDKVWFERNGPHAQALRNSIKGKPERWGWLGRCEGDPQCPSVDHVVVLGDQAQHCMLASSALRAQLNLRFTLTYADARAVVWTRR